MRDAKSLPADYSAALLLPTGDLFYGYGVGKPGTVFGEICFHTAMTGYQEILTDPSYAGQIVTFTFPHIGNVGCNPEDIEAQKPSVAGLILREEITEPSNWRQRQSLTQWLDEKELTGICGIDTRALTRKVRLEGACNVAIIAGVSGPAFETQLEEARQKLKKWPSLEGMELAKSVSCQTPYEWSQPRWQWPKGFGQTQTASADRLHVVAIDYGCKYNILRSLASLGCKITVVPAASGAEDILKLKPDGVLLTNGPGDPAATGEYAVPVIKALIRANMPLFGICLGHQLLGLALGAKTEKMHQGHHGANHPIQRHPDKQVEITSQNHGFVVSHANLPAKLEVTHLSLFDGTIAGITVKDKPFFGVQYHPESSPGPHDSRYLFEQFVETMNQSKAGGGAHA